MPELTDEHIESLFADLRFGEIQQIRSPGVDAARATVRRRRTVTSAAAGVALFAVAGGVAAVGGYGIAGRQSTVGPAIGPVTDDVVLSARRDAAAATINVDPEDQGIIGRELVRGATSTEFPVLGGSYTVKVACVGAGRLAIAFLAGAAGEDVRARASVPCGATADVQIIGFTFPTTGKLEVAVTPDAAATGQSGLVYQATLADRYRVQYKGAAERAVRTSATTRDVSAASSFLDDGGTRDEDASLGAGTYRLTAACAGSGTVTVTVSSAPEGGGAEPGTEILLGRKAMACPTGPAPVSLTFTYAGGDPLMITMDPDSGAAERAAAAYRMVRR